MFWEIFISGGIIGSAVTVCLLGVYSVVRQGDNTIERLMEEVREND